MGGTYNPVEVSSLPRSLWSTSRFSLSVTYHTDQALSATQASKVNHCSRSSTGVAWRGCCSLGNIHCRKGPDSHLIVPHWRSGWWWFSYETLLGSGQNPAEYTLEAIVSCLRILPEDLSMAVSCFKVKIRFEYPSTRVPCEPRDSQTCEERMKGRVSPFLQAVTS